MHFYKVSCFVLVVLCIFVVRSDDDGPEVTLKNGTLKGAYWKTRGGRRFSTFLAIPYARPPIGELRFKEPIPADGWEGVRDATKDSKMCWQRNVYTRSDVIEGDEDCLYLNVYTPQLPSYGSDPLPVMVFFHGGGFLCGAGTSRWYGPDILLDRDVVLVVLNYRLGPLGFLTTGDSVVPGNNGMKDQTLALRWVKKNIRKFGGDPKSVTLFGESAGGASAHFHTLSPLSKGLYKNAISQSGNAFCRWALDRHGETLSNSKKLAELLYCPSSSSEKMVECLRKVDARDIIDQDRSFVEWDYDPMIPFKPVIEPKNVKNAFLTELPEDMYMAGRGTNVPWISGLNLEEGGLKVAGIFGNSKIEEFNKDFDRLAPYTMLYHNDEPELKESTNKKIRNYYFGEKEIDKSTKNKLIDLFTDSWFLEGLDYGNRIHRKYSKSPLYAYMFAHRGVASFSSVFGGGDNDFGVCHVDECQYLFPVGDGLFPDKKPDQTDKMMAEIMTTLWVNFAKTGVPTPETNDIIPVVWKPVKSEDTEYYQIGPQTKLSMKNNLLSERVKFWRTIPNYFKEDKKTRDEL